MARSPKTEAVAQVDEDSLAPPPSRTLSLFGHHQAEQEFLSAWNSGRMHHAWLITGKRGIGKATFAYRVARFLLNHGRADGANVGGMFGELAPGDLTVPEDCQAVKLVSQGAHPDLRVLQRQWDEKKKRRKGEIVVDDVRAMGGFLSLTAGDGGWRVVIVDAADEMNRNAANAILKILEEPPKRSILLLLAHNPARLLPTIRSRCRTLPMRPLADADLLRLVAEYCPDLSDDDARSLATLAEGSIGRALDLQLAGGLHHYQAMIGLLKGLPRIDALALHSFCDQALKGEDGFRITTDLIQWWLGRAIAAAGRHQMPNEVVPGENALIRTMAASAPLDQWVQVWENVCNQFARAEAVNLDKKQVLISVFGSIERLVRPH